MTERGLLSFLVLVLHTHNNVRRAYPQSWSRCARAAVPVG